MALPHDVSDEAREEDRAAIGKTFEAFVVAWNKHDAHAFAMIFTEDADFTNVRGTHAHGRAHIEAFHAPLFAGIFKESHQTITIRSIRFLRPDLAAVDVDCEMTGAKSLDGTPRPYRKALVNCVMVRQADLAWLILVLHNAELTFFIPTNP